MCSNINGSRFEVVQLVPADGYPLGLRLQQPRGTLHKITKNYSIAMQTSKDMNQEQTIRLIQRYREQRLLWDTKHPHHLSAKMRKESWMKIASEFKWPVSVLKKKMASLLGSHRRELHREKKSRIRAAATGNKYVYSSKWFGYPHFAFMRNKNKVTCHQAKPIDGCDDRLSPEPARSPEESEVEYEEEQEHEQLARSLKVVQHISANRDPYIAFGNYIASELRKYDPRTLACVKHSIHNVIFQADLGNIQVPLDNLVQLPSQSSSSFVAEDVLKLSPASEASSE
ncbi:hypothetical protein PYW08_003078 [Mythimna loreyi]|uniref:Uncharacterized protein n=1 Tax=Mythimna loreyi TaxID=667449 RepID=A0ACC2QR94_9NEOP|nr:hypothetical protein PYW08_003078 [Mythimna loreyi]